MATTVILKIVIHIHHKEYISFHGVKWFHDNCTKQVPAYWDICFQTFSTWFIYYSYEVWRNYVLMLLWYYCLLITILASNWLPWQRFKDISVNICIVVFYHLIKVQSLRISEIFYWQIHRRQRTKEPNNVNNTYQIKCSSSLISLGKVIPPTKKKKKKKRIKTISLPLSLG